MGRVTANQNWWKVEKPTNQCGGERLRSGCVQCGCAMEAKLSAAPASGQTEPGASEHTSGTSEHDMAIGASEHTMSGKISLDDAIEKLQIHKEADELASKILAAAITLRDSKGRIARQLSTKWREPGKWIDE